MAAAAPPPPGPNGGREWSAPRPMGGGSDPLPPSKTNAHFIPGVPPPGFPIPGPQQHPVGVDRLAVDQENDVREVPLRLLEAAAQEDTVAEGRGRPKQATGRDPAKKCTRPANPCWSSLPGTLQMTD